MIDGLDRRGLAILAAIGAAAIAVAVILLTGGDDGGTKQVSAKVPTTTTTPSTEAAAKDAPQPAPSPAKPAANPTSAPAAPEGGTSEEDTKLSPEKVRKKLKVVPAEERRQFAQTAATGVLSTYGVPGVTAQLNRRADRVTVLISPRDACALDAAKAADATRRLTRTILFAKKVRLNVFGFGGVVAYVGDHCRPLEIPRAPGRVAWSAAGTGVRGSDPIQINSSRFTVAYVNNSGNLRIYVTRGNQLIQPVIQTERRETGTQTYPGPGTFNFTVTGSGDWEVRVYDGA